MIYYSLIAEADRDVCCACCTHDAEQNMSPDIYDIPETVNGKPVVKVLFSLGEKIMNTPKLYVLRYVEDIKIERIHVNQNPLVIEISTENPHLMSDGNAVYTKDMSRLLVFFARDRKFAEIPKSVRVIAPRAFENAYFLKKVVIHDGVEEIGDYAFSGCTSLAEAVLPKSVKKIGESAFQICDKLENIDLENVEVFGEGAFWRCTHLDNIKLTCRDIPDWLFGGCYSLKKLYLSNTQSIGYKAFNGLSAKRVVLPETVRSIGEGAFEKYVERLVVPRQIETVGFALGAENVELTLSENSAIFSGKSDGGLLERSVLEIYSSEKELLCAAMDYDRRIFRFCNSGKKLGFDFEMYDKDIPLKGYDVDIYRAALFRIAHPYLLSGYDHTRYDVYLKKFAEEYIECIFENFWSDYGNYYLVMNENNGKYFEEDAARTRFRTACLKELVEFTYCKYVSEEKLLRLIEISSERKDHELTALLLQKKMECGKFKKPDDRDEWLMLDRESSCNYNS